MDIDEIKTSYEDLSEKLKDALSKMELTDKVITIRNEIKDLQKLCPHNNGKYDFAEADECPYCGKKF